MSYQYILSQRYRKRLNILSPLSSSFLNLNPLSVSSHLSKWQIVSAANFLCSTGGMNIRDFFMIIFFQFLLTFFCYFFCICFVQQLDGRRLSLISLSISFDVVQNFFYYDASYREFPFGICLMPIQYLFFKFWLSFFKLINESKK